MVKIRKNWTIIRKTTNVTMTKVNMKTPSAIVVMVLELDATKGHEAQGHQTGDDECDSQAA